MWTKLECAHKYSMRLVGEEQDQLTVKDWKLAWRKQTNLMQYKIVQQQMQHNTCQIDFCLT